MVSAAPRLSPLIITARTPRARSAASAAAAPGLGSSPKASRAMARGAALPASTGRTATTETVAPCACWALAKPSKGFKSTPSSAIQRQLPMKRSCPCTTPSVPRPGTARTSCGAPGLRPRAWAAASTARASGCSLPLCRLAAACSAAASSTPGAGNSCSRRGWPTVRVPVLSKATVSTLWAISSASASLMRMPNFAATPVPAMMAVGVASPSAHGQAMTSTATARMMATSSPAPPSHHQPTKVSSAMPSTTGTNTAATRSTSRCTGALTACASCTSRMMWASTLSLPAAVTRISTRPSPLIEPPVSASPAALATGSGSPVSMDSSTCVAPSATVPSAGTRSPGRTASWSPRRSSSTGMSFSLPSQSIRCATSGRSACSARMAAVVWRLARSSSHLPRRTSVTTTAALSKYRCGMAPWPPSCGLPSHSHIDSSQAAVVPTDTSSSMLPLPDLSACQPAL